MKRILTADNLIELAKSNLIAAQKCAKFPDKYYTIPCYGLDTNILDSCRQWLFDKEISRGIDYEMARINANKIVLYVNETELDEELSKMK